MRLPRLSGIGNFFPKPRRRAASKEKRPFSVVQIEVTSRCGTGCVFCPHDALAGKWIEGDLKIGEYRRHIAPYLDVFDLVYLQGWGEPMLHPDLWEMIGLAQEKGCRTGFTTNGTRLEGENNERLLDLGVDLISVSFAGTAAGMHESLRTRSDFARLCASFEGLANLKKQRGCERPWLELHFLMTHANLEELPSLVELAASLGADEVVATNLTYSPSPSLDRMHVFGEHPLVEDLETIHQAERTAQQAGIPLRTYPLQTEPETLVCDADPLNTLFINHLGQLTPCVYLGLTVQGAVPRYFHGQSHPFETISFGTISEGLPQALQGKRRKAFVDAFQQRKMSNTPLVLLDVMSGQGEASEIPSPPIPCQFCYKMLGV